MDAPIRELLLKPAKPLKHYEIGFSELVRNQDVDSKYLIWLPCPTGLGGGFDDSMRGDPDRELVVFTEALEVLVQERATYLERVCAGDENLRQTVEALLRAHDRLGNFLEEPPTGATVE